MKVWILEESVTVVSIRDKPSFLYDCAHELDIDLELLDQIKKVEKLFYEYQSLLQQLLNSQE